MIAWEVTRACNLACAHCRGNAREGVYNNELDTAAAKKLIGQFKEGGNPLLIFTGGEPLLRADLFELLRFARAQGLRCAVSTNGTLLNRQNAEELAWLGVSRCSISLDEPQAEAHDLFRGKKGAFAAAMRGIEHLKEAGVPFQINTTLTAQNTPRLPEMLKLCQQLGAVAWHVFALLPVGRGAYFEHGATVEGGAGLIRENYAQTLRWLQMQEKQSGLEIKPTCAPQYYCLAPEETTPEPKMEELKRQKTASHEAIQQAAGHHANSHHAAGHHANRHADNHWPASHQILASHSDGRPGKQDAGRHGPGKHGPGRRGCLGGIGFCFVSHSGQVQPCGYLELDCGNVRRASFGQIWQGSPVLQALRQPNLYKGKCGQCQRRVLCGGCRVRALASGGDFMGPDPLCFVDFA